MLDGSFSSGRRRFEVESVSISVKRVRLSHYPVTGVDNFNFSDFGT